MNSTAFPVSRAEASSWSMPVEGAPRVTLTPLAASEWLVIVGFGGSLLAYVTAIGLAARQSVGALSKLPCESLQTLATGPSIGPYSGAEGR